MSSTQTRRKRRFGQHLATLRLSAGRTTIDAGQLLRKTASQVSKLENGWYLPAFAELAALVVYYGATEEQRTTAETLWQDAREDSKRIQGSSAVSPKLRAFMRSEADAATIKTVESCVMPGLLQTGDYAKAVRTAAHRLVDPSIDTEKATAARLARQELLRRPDPLVLHAIIDEGVVRRVVGGPDVMAAQLRHLLAVGEWPNVTVQVISEEAGAYGPMSGSFIILGFDDQEGPDAIYLEYVGGGEWVDDPNNIVQINQMFDDTIGLALSSAESAALIKARAEQLEGR